MGALKAQWMAMLKTHAPAEAERLIEAAIQADPTPEHTYVTWIVGQLRDEVIRLPHQGLAVRQLLTDWIRVKAATTFAGDRDIYHHGFYSLRRELERALRRQSVRQVQKRTKQEGTETVYDDGTYRIVKLTTPAAAVALARGTEWCTRDSRGAVKYLRLGNLFLIFRNERRYAQLHFKTGQMRDEANAVVVPDAALEQLLRTMFQPATLADWVGLSLVLDRSLLTSSQEQELLRWWSDRSDPWNENDEDDEDEFIDAATEYWERFYTRNLARRRRLVKLAREALAEGRLEVAWKLDALDLVPMAKLGRALRAAIQRYYAARQFTRLQELLTHFQNTSLLETNPDYFDDAFLEFLWRLFRLEPAASLAVARASLAPPSGRRDTFANLFLSFYRELKQCRAARLPQPDSRPPLPSNEMGSSAFR